MPLISAAEAKESVQWPVRNPLIQKKLFQPSYKARIVSGVYGARLKWGSPPRYDHHEGWDFYAFYDASYPRGHHPVHAVLSGKVFLVINPPSPDRIETGRKLVLKHRVAWSSFGAPKSWGRVFTGYNHLHDFKVAKDQSIKAGDILGRAGKSGYTRTVHLHFNCYRFDGKRLVNVNPARLFSKKKDWLRKLSARNARAKLIHFDKGTNRATLRILLDNNCLSFDGVTLSFGSAAKDRHISFEGVSALLRETRDRGDKDLFPGLRLFPFRFNGGESVDRLNLASRMPASWPARRHQVMEKQALLGWDIEVKDVPSACKVLKITLRGVLGEKIKTKCPLKR
jgi:hypothetical protein